MNREVSIVDTMLRYGEQTVSKVFSPQEKMSIVLNTWI